ncbi:hypothetical protein GF354_04860 [Candidatus Peregrinibacteria bacterium]|nr:hypothetical protein [Candidatus Peregrinibacteria bacterium]
MTPETNEIKEEVIHQKFQNWLNSEKADPENIEAVLEDIEKNLFPCFEYNVFHQTQEDRPAEKLDPYTVVIKDGLCCYDLSLNSGTCSELATKAHALIMKKYPKLADKISVLRGHEPKFFRNKDSWHDFVGLQKSEDELIILDPAFKLIGTPEDLNYTDISEIDLNNCETDYEVQWSYSIFAITKDTRCVCTSLVGTGENGLLIDLLVGVIEPKESVFPYRLSSKALKEKLIDEPEIYSQLEKFKTKVLKALVPHY